MRDLIDVYTNLAARCDYALHLGLTEAGMGAKGLIASTAGLAPLLLAGIGDTIRVSLTPKPGGDRTEEVQAAQQILQSLSIRSFMPQVTSCPGCGRTTSTYFQELAEQIQSYLRTSMPEWRKKYPGVEELKLAVMGCVVNGPGESKHANLGISLPGTFEEPKAPVYVDGKLLTDAARRHDRGGVQGDPRQVCREPLRAAGEERGTGGGEVAFSPQPSAFSEPHERRDSALILFSDCQVVFANFDCTSGSVGMIPSLFGCG